MTLEEVSDFLLANIRREARSFYRDPPERWLRQVAENWLDDSRNYDGRWAMIEDRGAAGGRILDMAAGCGTFLLFGLRQGRDVVGIEPEGWKREYFSAKIAASGYPDAYGERLVEGVGEHLPFADASFDLVTTYQTLEHVQDVGRCISEMLRVLRPGGALYVRAPDYSSFFEPHYRLPFLPRMDRRLARAYLRLVGRPLEGLGTLTWVTASSVKRAILDTDPNAVIADNRKWRAGRRRERVRDRLPRLLAGSPAAELLCALAAGRDLLIQLSRTGREEKTVDLWVTRAS